MTQSTALKAPQETALAPKTDEIPIYHLDVILGHISSACKEIVALDSSLKPLKMCFNGTLVTVQNGMSAEEVCNKWDTERTDYQKTGNENHSALCPQCKAQ